MARQPRIPMKSEIEQALLVLEHTERSTLVDCGADKRIRQLFKTTSTRRKAQDFDKSEMSPREAREALAQPRAIRVVGCRVLHGSCIGDL